MHWARAAAVDTLPISRLAGHAVDARASQGSPRAFPARLAGERVLTGSPPASGPFQARLPLAQRPGRPWHALDLGVVRYGLGAGEPTQKLDLPLARPLVWPPRSGDTPAPAAGGASDRNELAGMQHVLEHSCDGVGDHARLGFAPAAMITAAQSGLYVSVPSPIVITSRLRRDLHAAQIGGRGGLGLVVGAISRVVEKWSEPRILKPMWPSGPMPPRRSRFRQGAGSDPRAVGTSCRFAPRRPAGGVRDRSWLAGFAADRSPFRPPDGFERQARREADLAAVHQKDFGGIEATYL